MSWTRAHWLAGVLALLVFLLTGQYMLHVARAPQLESVPRLLLRSRHLFVMMSAVANLALAGSRPTTIAQKIASSLVLLSPFALTAAFFLDPVRGTRSSQLFHFSMYGVFVAGLLLAIANRPRRGTPPPRMLD